MAQSVTRELGSEGISPTLNRRQIHPFVTLICPHATDTAYVLQSFAFDAMCSTWAHIALESNVAWWPMTRLWEV